MAKREVEVPKGETMKVVCAGPCNVGTEHDVLAKVDVTDGNSYMDWWSAYQILECRGCRTISFRQASSNSESCYQVGEDEWVQEETVQLYPPRTAESRGLKDNELHHLPKLLQGIYSETRSALLNAMPVLAGIGLRAIVETLCNDPPASQYLSPR